MKRYIDLDEAINIVIRTGRDHAVESEYENAPQILGAVAADIIFGLEHLDRKELNE